MNMDSMNLRLRRQPGEPMEVDMAGDEVVSDAPEEEIILVENPTLDLETYANRYTGYAKLSRLVFIAQRCPSLRVEALKMILAHLSNTYMMSLYQDTHKHLVTAVSAEQGDRATPSASSLPDVATSVSATGNLPGVPPLDQSWIETRVKAANLKMEKLDADLKNYKTNSIKESIRRGQDDLGEHYLDCGNLNNALKCFSRARDYCTSSRHVVAMCLNVIKVSVYLQNWMHVLAYVGKAEDTPDFAELSSPSNKDASALALVAKLKCSAGLAALAMKKYREAAIHFLQPSFDHLNFPEVISPNNVAIYGGLCALATFDRQKLFKSVISNSSFKLFLELEPQLRDVIHNFYESKYASCLQMLDEMKSNLLLDLYLAPHVNMLYAKIRSSGIIQYFSPYLSADMHKMASAFNTTVAKLEDELMQLILEGQIQARIDSHNKILYAKDVDQRSTTFEKTLDMGYEYQRRTTELILRSAMIKNQIHVKSAPRDCAQPLSASAIVSANCVSARN